MATASDPSRVGRHDEEHLRRFVAARARGAVDEMRRWWEELVIDFAERMDGLVAAAHRGRLDDDEHEDAVALALARFSARLVDTFDGRSMGELVNACKTLAQFICMDVQRASMRAREAGSLDAGWDQPDGTPPGWEADEAVTRMESAERAAEARDFLAWALPRVTETHRRVMELTLHGAELEEISAELGISRENAYQRRSRGMRELRALKEQYDA